MVGLFSAWRGDEGGKMGVRDEEEREDGKPGEGVSGVAGLEGGNDDGLELVSSAELSDSLRKWVYLVFGTSSIMNLQSQVSCMYPREVHAGSTDSIKVFFVSVFKVSLEKDTRPSVCLPQCKSCIHPSGRPSSAHRQAAEKQKEHERRRG